LVAIGVFDKNKILKMFAGFFGIILSILMFTENMMVAVALISINLYLLYEGTE
jgi:succinate-acetate transporter protein